MKKNTTSERVYGYIYKTAMWTLGLSCVGMLFVRGAVPYDMSTSWSDEGVGSSLVFMRPSANAGVGDRVAQSNGAEVGGVSVFTVQEVVRREGVLNYQASREGSSEVTTLPASDLSRIVLVQVPYLGGIVHALSTTLGVMALVGLPLTMLVIDRLMVLVRKMSVRVPRFAVKQKKVPTSYDVYEDEVAHEAVEDRVSGEHVRREDVSKEYVTVLKPYHFQKRYGH